MYPDSPVLQRAVWQALRAALDLTEEEAAHRVLRAYADAPPAEPPPSETVCYYHLRSAPRSPDFRESALEQGVPVSASFLPCTLILVFYGPDGEAWAHRVQDFLPMDRPGSSRQILRTAGLYPVPSGPGPAVLYEERGKTFRKRTDLTLSLRLLSNEARAAPVSVVAHAPEVSIHYAGKD